MRSLHMMFFSHIFLVNMGILGLIHAKEQNKFILVVYQQGTLKPIPVSYIITL